MHREISFQWIGMILIFGLVTAIGSALLATNTYHLLSDMITEKNMPSDVVRQILLGRIPAMIVLIAPAATMFSVISTYTLLTKIRTKRDDQKPAITSTFGFSVSAVIFALLLSFLVFTLNNQVVPDANHESQQLVRTWWLAKGPDSLPDSSDVYDENRSPQEMTTSGLADIIKNFRDSDIMPYALMTDYYFKFSIPFACLALTISALALNRIIPGNSWWFKYVAGIGILIVYWLIMVNLRNMGCRGSLEPWIAAWGPNMIFFILATPLLFVTKHREPVY